MFTPQSDEHLQVTMLTDDVRWPALLEFSVLMLCIFKCAASILFHIWSATCFHARKQCSGIYIQIVGSADLKSVLKRSSVNMHRAKLCSQHSTPAFNNQAHCIWGWQKLMYYIEPRVLRVMHPKLDFFLKGTTSRNEEKWKNTDLSRDLICTGLFSSC